MQRTINMLHAIDPSKLNELEKQGVTEIINGETPEDTYYKYKV